MRRALLPALLLVLCLLPCLSQGTETRWALVVGIDSYRRADVTPLSFAVQDAKAFRDVLVRHAGFPEENIMLLTSEEKGDLAPTSGTIAFALEYFQRKAKPDDTFVLYFSGHGFAFDGDTFLLTVEADARSKNTLEVSSLNVSRLRKLLAQIPAGKVIVVMDACRNNPVSGRGSEDNVMTDSWKGISVRGGSSALPSDGTSFTASFFACTVGQRSFESQDLGHGFFSYYLIEGLKGKAARPDGVVTLDTLKAYLEKCVPDACERAKGRKQEPWVEITGKNTSTWAFAAGAPNPAAQPAPETASLIIVSEPAGAEAYLQGSLLGETPSVAERLAPGRYRIRVEKKGFETAELEKEVPAGKATIVKMALRPKSGGGLESIGVNEKGFEELRNLKDGSILVKVPAGSFTMGNHGGNGDERPAAAVALDSFYLGKYEITNEQFLRFARETKYDQGDSWRKYAAPSRKDHPVIMVSWRDAAAYCRWAGLRLPAEAEWERAARGPDGLNYPWGEYWSARACNNWGRSDDGGPAIDGALSQGRGTMPKGSAPDDCSGFGVMDMGGNVWEWCSSLYRAYPYRAGDGRESPDAEGPRAVRGGAWTARSPESFRTHARFRADPDYKAYDQGFRAAR